MKYILYILLFVSLNGSAQIYPHNIVVTPGLSKDSTYTLITYNTGTRKGHYKSITLFDFSQLIDNYINGSGDNWGSQVAIVDGSYFTGNGTTLSPLSVQGFAVSKWTQDGNWLYPTENSKMTINNVSSSPIVSDWGRAKVNIQSNGLTPIGLYVTRTDTLLTVVETDTTRLSMTLGNSLEWRFANRTATPLIIDKNASDSLLLLQNGEIEVKGKAKYTTEGGTATTIAGRDASEFFSNVGDGWGIDLISGNLVVDSLQVVSQYDLTSHTHTFASLTSKPTTIAGYGITDFNSLGDARWIELTDAFGGDVTGTYGATIVGDDSHAHGNSTITAGVDAAKIADGTVSNAEFQFINTVTSNVQTQINAKANDADVVHDTGDETVAGIKTFSSDPIIPDDAYDATAWNGVLEPPTKNAVRDKFETLSGVDLNGLFTASNTGSTVASTFEAVLTDRIKWTVPVNGGMQIQGNTTSVGGNIMLSNTTAGSTWLSDGFIVGIGGLEQAQLWNCENTPMQFYTNNLERFRIAAGGNVGVGTTVPDGKFEINMGTSSAFRLAYNDDDGSAVTYKDETISSTGVVTYDAAGSAPGHTFSDDVSVPDEAYAVGWNESLEVPTKNAVYDKIETLTSYTDEQAQDAVGAMIDGSLTYVDATPLLQRSALTGAITASAGSNATVLGSFTKASLDGAISDGNAVYTGDDHGVLGGLTDDDHTQYALLAGRAGSQTLNGGNAANEDLTLNGTTHATKTTSYVNLQTGGGIVGIGTATPTGTLQITAVGGLSTGSLVLDGANATDALKSFDISTLNAKCAIRMYGGTTYTNGPAFQIWPTGSAFPGMYFDAGSATGADINFRAAVNGGATGMVVKQSTGRVGVRTTAPDGNLEVNLGTNTPFRLSYNDDDGSAATYKDETISSTGAVTFDAVGSATRFIFSDRMNIPTATPASATATGTTGDIAWDANYIYICTATDTWKRVAIATW